MFALYPVDHFGQYNHRSNVRHHYPQRHLHRRACHSPPEIQDILADLIAYQGRQQTRAHFLEQERRREAHAKRQRELAYRRWELQQAVRRGEEARRELQFLDNLHNANVQREKQRQTESARCAREEALRSQLRRSLFSDRTSRTGKPAERPTPTPAVEVPENARQGEREQQFLEALRAHPFFRAMAEASKNGSPDTKPKSTQNTDTKPGSTFIRPNLAHDEAASRIVRFLRRVNSHNHSLRVLSRLRTLRQIESQLRVLTPPDTKHLTFSKQQEKRLLPVTEANKEFLQFEDGIMKVLDDLDRVDSEGEEVVRERRKSVVKVAQGLLDVLDAEKELRWQEMNPSSGFPSETPQLANETEEHVPVSEVSIVSAPVVETVPESGVEATLPDDVVRDVPAVETPNEALTQTEEEEAEEPGAPETATQAEEVTSLTRTEEAEETPALETPNEVASLTRMEEAEETPIEITNSIQTEETEEPPALTQTEEADEQAVATQEDGLDADDEFVVL